MKGFQIAEDPRTKADYLEISQNGISYIFAQLWALLSEHPIIKEGKEMASCNVFHSPGVISSKLRFAFQFSRHVDIEYFTGLFRILLELIYLVVAGSLSALAKELAYSLMVAFLKARDLVSLIFYIVFYIYTLFFRTQNGIGS